MPKLKRLHHGVGAKISVYTKFLHPRKLVMERYPNASKTDVLHGLLAVAQEDKTVSKKQQACIIMRHDDFDDGHLLHAVTRYCKIVEEGAPKHFFNDVHEEEGIEGGGGAVALRGLSIKVLKSRHIWAMMIYKIIELWVLASMTTMTQHQRISQQRPPAMLNVNTMNGIQTHGIRES